MNSFLDSAKIIKTIVRLNQRIDERFPGSGLRGVCRELRRVAHEAERTARWISRPQVGLRLLVVVIILLSLGALGYSISLMEISLRRFGVGEAVQVIEAGINNVVLIGAALFFLVTVEIRIKRSRALRALQQLRVVAHVIDMHQLTKDPYRLIGSGLVTASSPERIDDAFLLSRYLDYCSEMLSLTGKVAALYAQGFDDPRTVAAVNDIETLTTGLSRKVWQKITAIERIADDVR